MAHQVALFLSLSFLLFVSSAADAVEPLATINKNRCAWRPVRGPPVSYSDVELLQFAQNLEFLQAEFFLHGAIGYGLDSVAPELAMGSRPPYGARRTNLDWNSRRIFEEFGYHAVGHLRAIKRAVGGIERPFLDLRPEIFERLMDVAFGYHLSPPFDPFNNTLSFLLGSYMFPYLGLVSSVGTNPNLDGDHSKRLLAGLLAVQAGEDAIIRSKLYDRMHEFVQPYGIRVAEFTSRISELRNRLAGCGYKDEGVYVHHSVGAEGKILTNVISADLDSLAYERTPEEVLAVLYGTGDARRPGLFFPTGGNGNIASRLLKGYPHQ